MKETLSANRKRFRTERLLLCGVYACAALFLAWWAYTECHRVDAQEGDRLQVQARVVDDNVIWQLEGANTALASIAKSIASRELDRAGASTRDKLKLLTDVMPGVNTMLVLDADGRVTASSRAELEGSDLRHRAYFDVPRRSADADGLYIAPPFERTPGNFVTVISRTVTKADGEFGGVVAASLDSAYFNVVLRSVLYAPDMRTTLMLGNGQVFFNSPPTGDAPDADLSKSAALFAERGASASRRAPLADERLVVGDRRLSAIREINPRDLRMNVPLVVAVSRDRSSVYAPWRERVSQLAALWVLLLVGSAAVLLLIQRRRLALGATAEAIARERQAGTERVELALRGADLGLWDLRLPDNHFVVSARERELLGYAPEDELPQGPAWNDLIHPDDRAHVDHSIVAHLKGLAANYECEHRIRRKDGRYIWLSNRAMIVERDAAGMPLRIVGTHLDITDRKQTEAELATATERLRESEVQLLEVTDNMPALVSRFDAEQRLRFVNRAYLDWLGLETPSLIGVSLRDLYGDKSYETFRHHIEAALQGQRVVYERELATPRGARRVEVTLVPRHGSDQRVTGAYALIVDITARHEAETRRALSEERLSLALEGSGQALFDWDLRTGLLYHSAQVAMMMGDGESELTAPAVDFQGLMHPEDLAGVLDRMRSALKGTVALYEAEFRLRRPTGDWMWVRARGRVVERDDDGRALRLAGTYADINQRRANEARLRRLAEIDVLTGLPNRVLFQDRLASAMGRVAPGRFMALLFLDVDHFKTINDTLGHEAGDSLLQVFARRMQEAVRPSDTAARLGGDEFTVILEGLREASDASVVASHLVEVLGEPMALNGKPLTVTASIGLALCAPGETDEAALLRRADAALYEAKRRGRNGYFCHSGDSSWHLDPTQLMPQMI